MEEASMTLVEAMVLRVIPGDPNALGKIQLFFGFDGPSNALAYV